MCKRIAVTGLILLAGILLVGCNEQPVASIEVSGENILDMSNQTYQATIGSEIELDASRSYDVDGSVIFYHYWVDGVYQGSQESPILRIVLDRIGVTSVRLEVEDNEYKNSCESCVIAQIAVEEEPTPCPTLNVRFSLIESDLEEGDNVFRIDSFSTTTDYQVTVDGVEKDITTTGRFTVYFGIDDEKTILLEATNYCGNEDKYSRTFILEEEEPTPCPILNVRFSLIASDLEEGDNVFRIDSFSTTTDYQVIVGNDDVLISTNGRFTVYFGTGDEKTILLEATNYCGNEDKYSRFFILGEEEPTPCNPGTATDFGLKRNGTKLSNSPLLSTGTMYTFSVYAERPEDDSSPLCSNADRVYVYIYNPGSDRNGAPDAIFDTRTTPGFTLENPVLNHEFSQEGEALTIVIYQGKDCDGCSRPGMRRDYNPQVGS